MQSKSLVAGASALALMIGLGLSAPVKAGGLEDYIDDGTGYDDTAPAATSDDFDPMPEEAVAEPAPIEEEPVVEGPGLDDIGDAMLSELPDSGCALPGEEEPEEANRATLNSIDNGGMIDPCLATASVMINPNDTNGPNGPGNNNGNVAQSVLSLSALMPGSLFGGSTANNPSGQPVDSLLQVNVGTADRVGPNAEGPALIEVNLLDGLLVGENNGPGALQVTVLDAINGDGSLLDTTSTPLDILGGLLALGTDPAPAGLADVENFDGLVELNLGLDPDGTAGFNAIQGNLVGEDLAIGHLTVGDGLDDGFDTVAAVQIGADPEGGENPSAATLVVDNPALVSLLNGLGINRVTVLDGADGGGSGLGAVANIEGPLGQLLSPLGLGADGPGGDGTALDLLLEPLGLAGSGMAPGTNQGLEALVNLSPVLDPVNGLLGGGLTGQGPLGALTGPLQGLLTPILGLLGGATPR